MNGIIWICSLRIAGSFGSRMTFYFTFTIKGSNTIGTHFKLTDRTSEKGGEEVRVRKKSLRSFLFFFLYPSFFLLSVCHIVFFSHFFLIFLTVSLVFFFLFHSPVFLSLSLWLQSRVSNCVKKKKKLMCEICLLVPTRSPPTHHCFICLRWFASSRIVLLTLFMMEHAQTGISKELYYN